MNKLCTIPGCTKIQKARGWCSTHYGRYNVYGDPLFMKQVRHSTLKEAILAKSILSKNHYWNNIPCREWTASVDSAGYGQLMVNGVKWIASRAAYTARYGEIPEGKHVCHHCDNRWCVQPRHFFLGSHQDNMDDKTIKGRAPRGINQVNHKLTNAQVKNIKRRLKRGENYSCISKDYLVSSMTIKRIDIGVAWKHI